MTHKHARHRTNLQAESEEEFEQQHQATINSQDNNNNNNNNKEDNDDDDDERHTRHRRHRKRRHRKSPLSIEEYERDYRRAATDLELVERVFRGGISSNKLRATLWPYIFGLVKKRGVFIRRTPTMTTKTNGHSGGGGKHLNGSNNHEEDFNKHKNLNGYESDTAAKQQNSNNDHDHDDDNDEDEDEQFVYIEHEDNIKRWRELEKLYRTYETQWKSILPDQELRFSVFRERKALIERDVIRSDRQHPFYADETSNENLSNFTTLLMTYMMYDFDIGYLQGMSDLAAPILYVFQGDLVKSFWVFVECMKLYRRNFEYSQKTIHFQLNCLFKLIKLTDLKLAHYLKEAECSNCFFVFRCIVCQFKRELMKNNNTHHHHHHHQHSDYSRVLNLWDTIWCVQRRFELLAASKCVHTFTIATPTNNMSTKMSSKTTTTTTTSDRYRSLTLNSGNGLFANMQQQQRSPITKLTKKLTTNGNKSVTTSKNGNGVVKEDDQNHLGFCRSASHVTYQQHKKTCPYYKQTRAACHETTSNHQLLAQSHQQHATNSNNSTNGHTNGLMKHQSSNRARLTNNKLAALVSASSWSPNHRVADHEPCQKNGTARNHDEHKTRQRASLSSLSSSPLACTCSSSPNNHQHQNGIEPKNSKRPTIKQEQVVYTRETFYSSFDPNQADVPRFELTETEKFVLSLCLALIQRERNVILGQHLDASEIHQHFISPPNLYHDFDSFVEQAFCVFDYLNTDCDLQLLCKGANDLSSPNGLRNANNELSPIVNDTLLATAAAAAAIKTTTTTTTIPNPYRTNNNSNNKHNHQNGINHNHHTSNTNHRNNKHQNKQYHHNAHNHQTTTTTTTTQHGVPIATNISSKYCATPDTDCELPDGTADTYDLLKDYLIISPTSYSRHTISSPSTSSLSPASIGASNQRTHHANGLLHQQLHSFISSHQTTDGSPITSCGRQVVSVGSNDGGGGGGLGSHRSWDRHNHNLVLLHSSSQHALATSAIL